MIHEICNVYYPRLLYLEVVELLGLVGVLLSLSNAETLSGIALERGLRRS